ncbi:BQ5605_C001g00875 [Microbotryum silenes-dioicae]|uniref:BQ5605_C001g00875 protein n=1 Tax=Microbotryum silenes-dioicae TaxID=796604 RepID=A0A2X0P725_9BASI|nr:BQ5605_C001g00875 [Microbotryum silenes-dioicae]
MSLEMAPKVRPRSSASPVRGGKRRNVPDVSRAEPCSQSSKCTTCNVQPPLDTSSDTALASCIAILSYALTVVDIVVDIVINIRLVVEVKAVEVSTVVTVVMALIITLPVDMAIVDIVKVVSALDTTVNVLCPWINHTVFGFFSSLTDHRSATGRGSSIRPRQRSCGGALGARKGCHPACRDSCDLGLGARSQQTHFVSMAQRAQTLAKVIRPGQNKATRDLHRDRLKEEHKLVMATGARSWVQGMARKAQEPANGRRGRPKFKLALGMCSEYSDVEEQDLSSKHCMHFLACDWTKIDKSQVPWERVLVPFSFGLSNPTPRGERDRDYVKRAPQLVNLILDLHDHVLPRPSRLSAPGLAVNEHDAHLVVLDHDGCRIAVISDCWGSGYGKLSATLSILLDLDVYSAGFAPFLRYKFPLRGGVTAVSLLSAVFQSSSQHDNHDQQPVETRTRLVGHTVAFEDEEPIELVSCSTSDSNSVFGPCTTVFRLTRPSLHESEGETGGHSFVLQMQHVSPNFVGGEAEMLQSINLAHDSGVLPSETVNPLAMLEVAASLRPHRSQVDDYLLPRRIAIDRRGYARDPMLSIKGIRRTLDLLILRNPTPVPRILASAPGMSLDSPAPLEHVLHVFDQLLTVLVALHRCGFYHRNLALDNILHYEGHLVLTGWGGGVAARPGEVVFAAKIDEDDDLWMTPWTAPLNVLRWNMFVPGDDPPNYDLSHALESSIYWFLLVLGQLIAPAGEGIWSELLLQPDPARDRNRPVLFLRRDALWAGEPNFAFESRDLLLASIGLTHPALADLVEYMTRRLPKLDARRIRTETAVAAIQRRVRRLAQGTDRRRGLGTIVEAMSDAYYSWARA